MRKKFKAAFCVMFFCIVTLLLRTNVWCLPAKDTIKVAYKVNPFYSYENDDGLTVGLEVDILEEIAKEIGYKDVIYYPMKNIHECIRALENREVQIILGFPSFYDGDTSKIATSSEIVTTDLCMMAKYDIAKAIDSGEQDKFTAVFEHNTSNYAIVANMGASLYYVVGSQEEALDRVLAGKAQVMICDEDCMAFLLSKKGVEEEFSVIRKNVGKVGYTIALLKGDDHLLREVNDGILKIRINGKYEEILSRWYKSKREVNVKAFIRNIIIVAIIVGVIAAVYIYLSWRVRKILKHRVSEMTKELEKNIQQLQYESDLRNQILERVPNIMILCEPDGKVILMNTSARQLIGSFKENYNGVKIGEIPVIGDLVSSLLTSAGHFKLTAMDDILIPYRIRNAGRRIFRCSITNAYLDDSKEGFLIMASDVTKEENQKQEMIEQEKSIALSRLVAGIAHEIKNPLTGIQNFVDLIKTEKDNQQFWNYFSEYVPIEISRISRLIESLMEYARPSKGTKISTEVSQLINECTYLLNTAARSAKILFTIEVQPDMWIYVVRDQIKQMLINIMLNSLEAVERRREKDMCNAGHLGINVSAYRCSDSVIIKIEDTGEGMSEETIRNCMDPFYTTKERGTGLGLAISKQFIQENGGTMQIESTINEGTVISLTFKEAKHE